MSEGRPVLRVLVACEFSGVVRRAFVARGHATTSVDLLPAEDGANYVDTGSKLGFHYQGDIFKFLAWRGAREFDLMIAHPDCTRLTNAGVRWLTAPPPKQDQGADVARPVRGCSVLFQASRCRHPAQSHREPRDA